MARKKARPQNPSVGRIVHVRFAGHEHVWPAVITHVWSPECVNVNVFDDGSHPVPNHVPTSVMFDDTAEQESGNGITWFWPPRT